jgi:uncharacterized protein YciI
MAGFRTRDAPETFVAGDPFVHHEVARRYQIRDWHEILS